VQIISLPNPAFVPTGLGFSPDGHLLAASNPTGLFIVDLDAGTARELWRAGPFGPYDRDHSATTGFTADGRGVLALRFTKRSGDNTGASIGVFDVSTGALVRERIVSGFVAFDIGPGGRLVYATRYGKKKQGIVRWNPLTDTTLPVFGEAGGDTYQLAVSADERCVLATRYDAVRVLKFKGDEPPQRASRQLPFASKPAYYSPNALTVSADGAFAAASMSNAGGCHVEAWTVATGEHTQVATGSTGSPAGRNVHFNPTRPLLAYHTGTDDVTFWDAAARAEVKRFAWGVGTVSAVRFSADGLRCACAAAGKVVVWDVDV
jgi:hypothetical protein